jgi:hypothetical protein
MLSTLKLITPPAPVSVNVPAGIRTTVLDPAAEAIAALIEANVTVPPNSVLQAVVTQLALPVGMPPSTPAVDQSTALLVERIPDQF